MSRGETFPDIHGQLDVSDLAFQIADAPSSFTVNDFSSHIITFNGIIWYHNNKFMGLS